jgi:hypothetical protein
METQVESTGIRPPCAIRERLGCRLTPYACNRRGNVTRDKAHVLRRIPDAQKGGGKLSSLFREGIRALYGIEREANEAELDHARRLALRRSRARPILARVF